MQHQGDGTALVRARVPESVALRLTTMLESFTNLRRESGEAVAADGDGRRVPYERRLGEAFCSLMEALDPARLPLHGGDATTLVITMDLATLTAGLGTASLADGTRISAGEARRLACTAGLVPAVLGTRSVPLDLGHASRLFSPGQRKALAIRDRECRADGPRERGPALLPPPPSGPRRPLPAPTDAERRPPVRPADVDTAATSEC
ncbi:DUF222 domain-containing protein [Nocardioides sp. dk4132]|uniref:DUF222 domain-containing protein n=1 Tax=unclassified Nocardioides TaxID=2615069 RepID=UPI001295A1C6|nr:DUF222 domain-containing protein [Nocardioides sp. dk4132]QGA07053.1 DUF222 domain-containing protein [Nocardioides sp. dk884]